MTAKESADLFKEKVRERGPVLLDEAVAKGTVRTQVWMEQATENSEPTTVATVYYVPGFLVPYFNQFLEMLNGGPGRTTATSRHE